MFPYYLLVDLDTLILGKVLPQMDTNLNQVRSFAQNNLYNMTIPINMATNGSKFDKIGAFETTAYLIFEFQISLAMT